MVVPLRRQRLILPVAPSAAAAIGTLTAAVFALLPTGTLESLVVDSGVAAVLTAAEPPLGLTARLSLALLCGGGVALVAWFALFLLLGTRSVVLGAGLAADEAPLLRRADAHPDAPARRPVFANRDLGTPFLDVRARPVHVVAEVPPAAPAPQPEPVPEERALPADLDQPLAGFGAVAAPDDWFPPPAQLAPRRQIFAPGERLETFPLTRPSMPPPAPPLAPLPLPLPRAEAPVPREDPSVTIHALLDRLERSVARHEAAPEPPPQVTRGETLEDTLSTLRKLATRGA